MKDVLERIMNKVFAGVTDFLAFQELQIDAKKYERIAVADFFCHIRPKGTKKLHEVYREVVAKLCYLCDRLWMEVEVEDGSQFTNRRKNCGQGAHPRVVAHETRITPLCLSHMLEDYGFELELREASQVSSGVLGLETFKAKRMPEVVWDGKATINSYRANTVVEVPLDFPWFVEKIWPRLMKTEEETGFCSKPWWSKVEEIVKDFKPWMFAPLTYCKRLNYFNQGGHRLTAAKAMKLETVKIRIVERNWWRSPYEIQPPI